ncbi:MAG TPA: Mu-like prophage major head subunit gpT family protein [Fluviicoccus sp.]|nr:Mu-like prophage major head subunit gpT family protein [Fluviicoccus sp.]
MIVNRDNLQNLYTGFKAVFQAGFTAVNPLWMAIAMTVPSTTRQEAYAWLGATTKFREWLGDREIQNLEQHDYTIKNKSFENTVGVDRDDIEDDTYGVYKPMFEQLGRDAKEHPDELVFNLLKAGWTTKCYDGENFFSATHKVKTGDTSANVSNSGGGSGTPWYLIDDTRAIKPIIFQKRKDYQFVKMDQDTDEQVFSAKRLRYGVDCRCNVGFGLWQLAYGSKQTLNADNYQAARTAMMSMKGDNERPLNIRPTLLVVPPSLEKAALECVQTQRLANGADNPLYNTAKVLVVPWLA